MKMAVVVGSEFVKESLTDEGEQWYAHSSVANTNRNTSIKHFCGNSLGVATDIYSATEISNSFTSKYLGGNGR
jgi:hypothetical protein